MENTSKTQLAPVSCVASPKPVRSWFREANSLPLKLGLIKWQYPKWICKILWTDMNNSSRCGQVKLHNDHLWPDHNPHWLQLQKHEGKWSFNAWCGSYRGQPARPYFFHQNLRSSLYESHMLRGAVGDLTSSISVSSLQYMLLQYDEAQSHASRLATDLLNANFAIHWISAGAAVLGQQEVGIWSHSAFLVWSHIKT